VAFVKLLVRVVLVVALLWFGWRAYVNATEWLSAQSRLDQVSQTWQGSEAARKAAGTGSGQIASGLTFDPVEDGYNPVASWDSDGATLVVTTSYTTCDRTVPLQLDIRESRDVVVVLVREKPMWLPSRSRLFPPRDCTAEQVFTEVSAPIKAPVAKRVLVDGATGASVGR
jgi:hypothetical protein